MRTRCLKRDPFHPHGGVPQKVASTGINERSSRTDFEASFPESRKFDLVKSLLAANPDPGQWDGASAK
jgi:hypothetical protein